MSKVRHTHYRPSLLFVLKGSAAVDEALALSTRYRTPSPAPCCVYTALCARKEAPHKAEARPQLTSLRSFVPLHCGAGNGPSVVNTVGTSQKSPIVPQRRLEGRGDARDNHG